jgi:Zn-dependent protease
MDGNQLYGPDAAGGPPPQPIIIVEVSPAPPPQPPARFRRRVWLPVGLFVATCLSTFMAGLFPTVFFPHLWPQLTAEQLLYALKYSSAVMTILLCHEMGHFLQAWRCGVHASLPYFIPFPFSPIGTFGAVIGMEPRRGSRRDIFDIGISGPIAGLVPTLIFLVLGLHWSRVDIVPPGAMQYGDPLLVKWLVARMFGAIPPGCAVTPHPVAFAAWVGLLITSLNLIPVGQLDGGHVLYGMLRQKAHGVATLMLGAAIAAALIFNCWQQWWLMLVLLCVLGARHPPTADDSVPLGRLRCLLGILMFAFVPIGFTPHPVDLEQKEERAPPPERRPPDDGDTIVLVPQRLDGGGDAAAEVDEGLAGAAVADFHDGRRAEQAAEVDHVARLRPRHGNQPHGRRLVVHHADGHLVGDDGGDGFGRGVAGDGDHVQADGADARHGFELFQDEVAASDGLRQGGVFAHGDERPA